MTKLAVIGANAPSIPFYRQAKALGYTLIGIAWAEGAVCKKYCDRFYPISFKEKEEVLRICKEEKIDGITSFSLESALPTVVYVAQHLGLVSNTEECVKLTENKFAQRKAFEDHGIPVPKYLKLKKGDVLGNTKTDYPIIVKPLDSGGSQGITKLDSPEGLTEALNIAFDHSRSEQAIIEEFIDGREFSVEALSHNGTHYILQITDKVTSGAPHFIEIQHHQPADIPTEIANRIKEMVSKALTALQIENSPSHTEIKLNSKGELYIIEIGARMGGDFISSDLVRLSTGYDMVKGAIELAVGKFKVPQISTYKYSGVYFYSALAPHIGEIIRNHSAYPEIVEYETDDSPLREAHSNADRNGYFLYQSNNGKMTL
ncbi:MAG: ATP-grasp domain-containing protein [Bacteroidales bacterium]|nr:ATP-grasp domain-containing protein [Bacteroidales bacterium]